MIDDLPYQIWDDSPVCPHCGSDFVEIEECYESSTDTFKRWFECCDCGRLSLQEIDDEIE